MGALYRSWKNTTEAASVGVIAEALDEAAGNFYLNHEFIPLLEHRRKLFVALLAAGLTTSIHAKENL